MKKLFSLIAALLLMFSFTACDSSSLQSTVSELETQIAQLETTIEGLEAEKAALETQKSALETDLTEVQSALTNKTSELETLMGIKASLDADNAALEAQIVSLNSEIDALATQVATLSAELIGNGRNETEVANLATIANSLKVTLDADNVVVITVLEETGLLTKFVEYDDDFEGTLFDLLDANFEVDASTSQWGHMINSLESLSPLNGQFISFLVNGESSMVGVDTVALTHGNVYSFELAWWDTTEQAVEEGIQLYVENYAADAVNATSIDYTVAAGLAHLGVLEEFVTDTEVQAYVDSLTLTAWNDYVKAIVILEAAELDASSLYTALNAIAAPAGFGATGHQLNAFAANGTTIDYSAFELAALADLNSNTPESLGVDSGAPCVLALSYYTDEPGVNTLISDWVSYIKTNQTEDGKILDKDFGWGQSESAATMAQAILGLVANDVNPKGADATGADMTQLNYDLLAGMTSLATDTGAYLGWDGNPDLGFSTPQAFLALVVYQMYSNNGLVAVNAYSFE